MKIPFIEDKLILSIYDDTTQWVRPYINAGYPVICWDKKKEGCILEGFTTLCIQIENAIEAGYIFWGLLAAPPCTEMAVSGAQYWKKKDLPVLTCDSHNEFYESPTDSAKYLFSIILHIVELYKPFFWVMENPVGRVETLMPEFKPFRKIIFNPCDYGDPYTKKTILWGQFNENLQRTPVEPVKACKQGSWLQKLGGKSEKTKALRSATPRGFAKAFFEANN